jgi:hypothetical protein
MLSPSLRDDADEDVVAAIKDLSQRRTTAGAPRPPTLALKFRNYFIRWRGTAAPALDFSF